VNRLVVPQSGSVYAGEQNVADRDAVQLRRGIGYVIQAVGLFSHMTVGANIAVVPSLLGWDKARVDRRTDELLDLVGLEPARYRDRYPRQLSGGEQQRVGVARAIAAEPAILLMDEPFGAVDAIVRRTLQDEIRRIAGALHATILFVTHDVEEALRLADRIVVMREGRIVQQGTAEEILRAPATPYVSQLFAIDPELRRYDSLRAAL
jgi:osmoprotectant transport system ATP-binding protein